MKFKYHPYSHTWIAEMPVTNQPHEQMKPTNRQIRSFLFNRYTDLTKIVFKRNGEVHARSNAQRGDGGRTPWWVNLGRRSEIVRDFSPYL